MAAKEAAEKQAKKCMYPNWGEDPHGEMGDIYGQNVARRYTSKKIKTEEVRWSVGDQPWNIVLMCDIKK